MKNKISSIIFLIALSVGIFLSQKAINDLNKKIDKSNITIEDLEGDINLKKNQYKETFKNVKLNKESLNVFNETGESIAKYQNEYYDTRKGDYKSENIENIANKLNPYFGDSGIGPTPWYYPNKDIKMKYKWYFLSNKDFRGAYIKVKFICKNDKNEILAVVLGDYNIATKKVSNIEKYLTTIGFDYLDTEHYVEDPTGRGSGR